MAKDQTPLMFDRLEGVKRTAVGYAQGHKKAPTYEEVCSGTTGHAEAVQVVYDPTAISMDQLLVNFMHKINPLQHNGQGADHGTQYRSGVYYHAQDQKESAESAVAAIPGCTVQVEAFESFWPAEVYHQKYLEKGAGPGAPQCSTKGCKDAIRCYG